MRILVTNDDGVESEGIRCLSRALAEIAEVVVVAPDREQSAASHSISLHRPLRITELDPEGLGARYAVDGTPTDCAYVAINHLCKERPALLASGINKGGNLGDDVTYSGTVAAAFEGTILGVPSFAISLAARPPYDFGPAARFAAHLARAMLERPLPPLTLLNVNVPARAEEAFAVTRMGRRSYGNGVVEKVDPRGRRYYWIGGDEMSHEDLPGSDCNAVLDDRLISVTPLRLDLTNYEFLPELANWSVGGFTRKP